MITMPKNSICNRIGITDFLETDLHKYLQRLPNITKEGPWIAGGAVRRTLTRIPLTSDLDFFFKDEAQEKKFVEDIIRIGAIKKFENEFNSTWIIPAIIDSPELKIQVIKFRYYSNPLEVIDSFDFTLCQFAYDSENIYMSDFAMWDVSRKRIVPHKLTYATASLRRLLKYINQGFTVCNGGLADILNQVSTNPQIIEADIKYID